MAAAGAVDGREPCGSGKSADYYLFGGGGAVGKEGDADHGGAGSRVGYFHAVEGEVADAQRGAVAVEAVDAGAAVVGGDGEDALVAGTLDGDGGRVKGLGGDYPYLVALDLEVGGDGDVDAVEALDAQRGAEGGGALVVLEVEDAGCGVEVRHAGEGLEGGQRVGVQVEGVAEHGRLQAPGGDALGEGGVAVVGLKVRAEVGVVVCAVAGHLGLVGFRVYDGAGGGGVGAGELAGEVHAGDLGGG